MGTPAIRAALCIRVYVVSETRTISILPLGFASLYIPLRYERLLGIFTVQSTKKKGQWCEHWPFPLLRVITQQYHECPAQT